MNDYDDRFLVPYAVAWMKATPKYTALWHCIAAGRSQRTVGGRRAVNTLTNNDDVKRASGYY